MLPSTPVLQAVAEQRQAEIERYIARLELERIVTREPVRPAASDERSESSCRELAAAR